MIKIHINPTLFMLAKFSIVLFTEICRNIHNINVNQKKNICRTHTFAIVCFMIIILYKWLIILIGDRFYL
jgi:hypothetical protein